ncbi:MAG: hypothetical protein AAFY29_22870 [Pseudomonadota bacterium]
MSNQIALPTEVSAEEIARKRTFGAAMVLCAELGGYELDKQLQTDLEVDKAQFSRWKRDGEGIHWKKLRELMDLCGNHAPVLWMLHQLGYDLESLRKRETEIEKQLREEKDRRAAAEARCRVLEEVAGIRKASGGA